MILVLEGARVLGQRKGLINSGQREKHSGSPDSPGDLRHFVPYGLFGILCLFPLYLAGPAVDRPGTSGHAANFLRQLPVPTPLSPQPDQGRKLSPLSRGTPGPQEE